MQSDLERRQSAGVFALQITALQSFVHAFGVLLALVTELEELFASVEIVFELKQSNGTKTAAEEKDLLQFLHHRHWVVRDSRRLSICYKSRCWLEERKAERRIGEIDNDV